MISLSSELADLRAAGVLSVRAYNVCSAAKIATLADILATDLNYIANKPNCGRKTIFELNEIISRYSWLLTAKPEEAFADLSKEEIAVRDALTRLKVMDIHKRLDLDDYVAEKFDSLNIRAKKAFPTFRAIEILIPLFYSGEKINTYKIRNVGRKTETDVTDYINKVKDYFENATKNIDIENPVPASDSVEIASANLGRRYPFLSASECRTIVNFQDETGIFPFLFVVRRYISVTDNQHTCVCRDYYGLNPDGVRHRKGEIASRYNIGTERVRQIKEEGIPLPPGLKEYVERDLKSRLSPVLASDDPFWENLADENMLDIPASLVFALVCSLLDDYSPVRVNDDHKEYLVNKPLLENLRVRTVLSNILRIVRMRRTKSKKLDILKFVDDGNAKYHPQVSLLCSLYADYLHEAFGFDITDNRFVVMEPNAIDIPRAIEEIIEAKGEPIEFRELFDTFNRLYPEYAYDNDNKFRAHIFRNKNIKAKGKSGVYLLAKWDGHYTGTITSYLEQLLSETGKPTRIDHLVDRTLQQFPRTSWKSILALLFGDGGSRFTLYEGDYVGLTRNHTDDCGLEKRHIPTRYTFANRFDTFKEFVMENGRIPASNGDEYEQKLFRWMRNVFSGNIDTHSHQVEALKTFLDENRHLPQNGTEYKFLLMCERLKEIIERHGGLPSRRLYSAEYDWFKKYRLIYRDLQDKRKGYFEEVLNVLETCEKSL